MTDLPSEIEVALDVAREGGEVGVQVAAYVHGELVVAAWTGSADRAGQLPVEESTLFPASSLTTGVPATAPHLHVERGLADDDAPVARYWPEYTRNGKATATVRDVLSHRSGAPRIPADVTPELMADWDWPVDALAAGSPLFPPGEVNCYQPISSGRVEDGIVRRTDPHGRSFGTFVHDEPRAPLGIDDLYIGLPDEATERVAELIDDTAFGATAGAAGPRSAARCPTPTRCTRTRPRFSDIRERAAVAHGQTWPVG